MTDNKKYNRGQNSIKCNFPFILSPSSPTHQESWGATQLHFKVLCWQYVLYILIWFKTWSNYRELLDDVLRHNFLLYTSTAKTTENQTLALKLQQLFCHTKVTFPKLPSVALMWWCSLEGLSGFLPIGGVTWHGQQQTFKDPWQKPRNRDWPWRPQRMTSFNECNKVCCWFLDGQVKGMYRV